MKSLSTSEYRACQRRNLKRSITDRLTGGVREAVWITQTSRFLIRRNSMTNGSPLAAVLCIAGGSAAKFQGRLRRGDLGVEQAEKQELRAKNGSLARGYRKP